MAPKCRKVVLEITTVLYIIHSFLKKNDNNIERKTKRHNN